MKDDDEFFIGWSGSVGSGLLRFLCLTSIIIVGGLAGISVLLATSITDPARSLLGAGAVPDPWQDVTLSGILTSEPYPVLRVLSDTANPAGHSVLLSGDGKRAAAYDHAELEGRPVEVKGLLLKRGTIDMLVVSQSPRLLKATAQATVELPKSLGRWRVVGEICDGKCGSGIMTPGTGIAHKACASLCLIGGVPPVLVLTHPLEGYRFLMISDDKGRALDDGVLRFVGMRVEIEGEVELRGDIALLRVEPGRMRRL